MKKTIFLISLIALMAMVSTSAVAAPYKKMQVQFVDERGEPRTDLSYVAVYNAGTATASTIKGDFGASIAITNPMNLSSANTGIRASNGMVEFWTTQASVDIVAAVGGVTVKYYNVNASQVYFQVPYITRPGAAVNKGGYQVFRQTPGAGLSTGAAPGGTAGNVNILSWPDFSLEAFVIGTQTILVPPIAAGGLDITYDLTNNDGIELSSNMLASSPSGFVIGTDGPFHFRAKLKILGDVAHSDERYVGFRLAEAGAAAIATYKDLAALNVNGGNIYTSTNLNDAASPTAVDTTKDWATTETHILEVDVSQTGVVTFKIDGVAPPTTQAFTFDTGDVVIPFIRVLHDSAITTGDGVLLLEWDCGLDD